MIVPNVRWSGGSLLKMTGHICIGAGEGCPLTFEGGGEEGGEWDCSATPLFQLSLLLHAGDYSAISKFLLLVNINIG